MDAICRFTLACAILISAAANRCDAADHGAPCGCQEQRFQKVCRLVCEMKKVKVVCYGCECEDFCIPGPSTPGCEHCDNGDCGHACDKCGHNRDRCECQDYKPSCKFRWKEWKPSDCAEVRTRKKLIKYEVTKEIPSYKWVVEKVPCGAGHCGNGACANGSCAGSDCVGAPAEAGGHVAPPPVSSETSAAPAKKTKVSFFGR